MIGALRAVVGAPRRRCPISGRVERCKGDPVAPLDAGPYGKTTLKTVQSYRMRADFEDVSVGRDAPGLDRARRRE